MPLKQLLARVKFWPRLLAVLAGSLITLSLAPVNFWPASLLAPLLLWRLLINTPLKQAVILGWLFGLGLFGSGASWVFVSIYYHSATPLAVALLLTSLFIAFLACFYAFFAWVFSRYLAQAPALLAFPALWLLVEMLRSWLFTGFPWLLLASGHLNSPFTGWLPLVGVYATGFLLVLAALAGYLLIEGLLKARQKQQSFFTQAISKHNLGLALCLLIIFGTGLGFKHYEWTQPTGETLSLGLVQPNTAQADKWQPEKRFEILRNHLELTQNLAGADLILWPETSIPLFAQEADSFFSLVLQQTNPNAGLISGLITYKSANDYYNSLVSAGAASGSYDKVKLVPFGEYVPFESLIRGITDFFNLPMSGFSQGKNYPSQLSFNNSQIAPLICYEVAYPNFSAKQAKAANWLLTVSNDAWFGESLGPLQHLELAQLRALESGKPLVRVTNTGISGLVSHLGQLEVSLPRFTASSAKLELAPREGQTPFSQLTTWPWLILSLLLLAWAYLSKKINNWVGVINPSCV